MLQPKKQKYKKQFRRRKLLSLAQKGSEIAFGEFGLKAVSRGILSEKQIEASRRAISFFTRKGGKIWIRVFPDKPITKKPAGMGMGSGKGEVVGFVIPVSAGRIIFEVSGIPFGEAKRALGRAADKLPLKTRFVSKNL